MIFKVSSPTSNRFAATMPRTALRYAVEHLDKTQRDHYMGLKKQS